MNKLLTKIAALSVGLAMAIGVGVAVSSNQDATQVSAAEEVYAEAIFNSTNNSAGVSSYTASFDNTTNGFTWNLQNFNNNNNGWNYVKCGRKNTASVGTISTSASVSVAITKVTITIDALTASKINSITLYGGASASTSLGTFTAATGTQTVTIAAGSQSTNQKYKISFDCASGSSNGLITVSSVKLYYNASTPQTITVDPASNEAYTDETISLTTSATSASWALSNNTCGASLSAASGKTVTVSATGAGSVRVTASASGYTSPYVDLTFIERPTSPYITPEKSSTSGYTGMDETISVTYGNLTSGLAVSSNNTSVVDASIDYDDEDGNADILLEFNGAGSTTVSLKDGSTQLATISVSVTASSVTITGLPSVEEVGIGSTLDLESLITVTATGSMGNSVVWSSDNTSKATVDANGVVSGVAVGSANITVKSLSQPSVSMTCAVTVKEITEFVLFNGEITEGDYVIYSDGVALKNSIASNRAEYTSVSPSNNKIIDPDNSIVWNIQKSGESWLVVSKDDGKYLAGNGTKNQISLFDDTSADRTWSITGPTDGAYSLVSNRNNSASVNDTLRRNGTYGFACYGSGTGTGISLYKAPSNELDHVTTSGQTTSFTAGNTFSYGGTLTAYYTIDDPATKTPTSFKLDSESGATITTSTVLTKSAHDGHEIYVLYTEDDITKSAHYTITVDYAAVTSVVINQHAAEIGLEKLYDGYKSVGVTVNSQYADQGYEWIVSANTVNDDYLFDASGLLSGNTEGTITLRCRSTADNSKYDELVVTITGDPTAAFVPDSISGFIGKSSDVEFTYGNMSDTSLISITSSNSSIAEVDEFVADEGEGLVTVNFVAAGSTTLSISYDGGSSLDSITVTVSADSVTALTWSAPTIKVYSGATTTVSDASSWNVHYTMASGDYGSLVYGEYTLKLGGSSITLPHTWDASEDGKVLSIEYGGFASPTTTTVDVTQTLQAVNADIQSEPVVSDLTFSAACGGSGTADDGASWTITSDGTESNWISGAGIHYGTNSASVTYIQLDNSDIAPTNGNKTITKIEVNARDAQANATLSVTVGGNAFGTSKSLTNTSTAYTFEGSAKGAIQVKSERTGSMTKALYVLFVKVTYVTSSGTANIANVAGHEAAQKAVVAFAKAMNAAFDDTENCTTGIDEAWSTASGAYSSNIANNASLSAEEKAYAKNLIKYASAQYTDDTDDDYSYCLERAMATYEACIQKHGQNAFMNDVRPVSASSRITPLSIVNGSGNTVAIIVVISMISVTAIGGYFFLRKRKEN